MTSTEERAKRAEIQQREHEKRKRLVKGMKGENLSVRAIARRTGMYESSVRALLKEAS